MPIPVARATAGETAMAARAVPLLCMQDTHSIYSWAMTRRLLVNVGRVFQRRVQVCRERGRGRRTRSWWGAGPRCAHATWPSLSAALPTHPRYSPSLRLGHARQP